MSSSMTTAKEIDPVIVLNNLVTEMGKMKPLLPTYFHLIASAVFPIYIAAHASLRRPPSAAPVKKTKTGIDDRLEDDGNEDSTTPLESLTASDAVLFPVLAGVTLTGLYLVIKWLEDPALLNRVLGYYFSWMGTFFTFKFIKDFLYIARSFAFPAQLTLNDRLYQINASQTAFTAISTSNDKDKGRTRSWPLVSSTTRFTILQLSCFKYYWSIRRTLFTKFHCTLSLASPLTPARTTFSLDSLDFTASITSLVLAILPFALGRTPWYLTNLAGFAFSYGSLQFISPGTPLVGSLLLSLLFVYDIYMVFYTPMMVTVATKLDVPIKLLIPRPVDTGACPEPLVGLSAQDVAKEVAKCLGRQRGMAMLGLGDVVVPGIMIAFALRFDLENWYRKTGIKQNGKDAAVAEHDKDTRPEYIAARGMWAERMFTAKEHWSDVLKAKAFPKPYFTATIVGYVLGMVATVVVMQVFKHAQPALLYLVPAVLSTFWGMALWKGEVGILWKYDEAFEEKEAEKKQQEQDDKNKEAGSDESVPEEAKNTEKKAESKVDLSKPMISFNVFLTAPKSDLVKESTGDVLTSDVQPDQLGDDLTPESDSVGNEDGVSTSSWADIVSKDEAETGSEKTEEESSEEEIASTEHAVKRLRKV